MHQGGKLTGKEREAFFSWLYDFEYMRMSLPRPDLVICLDMPTETAIELMRRREQQSGTHADIHERDEAYLRQCRETALEAAQYYGWTVVPCTENGLLRSVEEIHEQIYAYVMKCLEE